MSVSGFLRFWRFLFLTPRHKGSKSKNEDTGPETFSIAAPPDTVADAASDTLTTLTPPYQGIFTVASSSRVDTTFPPLDEMGHVPGYLDARYEAVLIRPPPPQQVPEKRSQAEIFIRSKPITAEEAKEAVKKLDKKKNRWQSSPIENITITDTICSLAYHYTLETFGESRSIKWYSEPFRGGDITNTGNPPGPWDIQATPPELFKAGNVDLEVPNTSSIKPCHRCQSLGSDRCEFCFGTGRTQCSLCSGTGIRTQFKDGSSRQVACGCMSGQQWCSHCTGTGRRRCNECQGRRFLRWFILLSVTWTNHEDEHIEAQSALDIHHIRQAQGDMTFEEVLPKVCPVTSFALREIDDRSQELVFSHGKHTNEKILMQRQRIRTIPVTQVFYSSENKFFSFFVFGLERSVHAPDYPEANCCSLCSVL